MFLRRNRRRKNGEVYDYWTLVRSVRTARGPRQQVVASLGKLPGLDVDERAGWEDLGALLDGAATGVEQGDLFVSAPGPAPAADQVDLSGVRVERVRAFGEVYLALAVWRRLGLHGFFAGVLGGSRGDVPAEDVAFILAAGSFCEQASELAVGERWYAHTALEDLLGVDPAKVYENRLYRGLDRLLPQREGLFGHLKDRYESLFQARFEFLLYDVTSTYFEGECKRNAQARRGYSRDSRPDCKQVCIGLVATPEGLPLAYEVFAGNRRDVTTVADAVALMEKKYGAAERVWVMDRGMVSEENLQDLRGRGARYLVGVPRAKLKGFAAELLEEAGWERAGPGVEVKLVEGEAAAGEAGGGTPERHLLCRSVQRREKEAAMLRGQVERLTAKLGQIHASLQKKPAKAKTVERRVGRWLGRNTSAEKLFEVEVLTGADKSVATGLSFTVDADKQAWAEASHGAYLLRTNHPGGTPAELWRWYIQLTEVEDAFRSAKSDLGLRPVFHHREDRVQAHIMVCFIALAMLRALEGWMRSRGLGGCARQLIKEVATVKSMDVVLPVKGRGEIRLRVVGKPEPLAADLLAHLGLKLPGRPKIVENVVEKN